jgi:hypothetical protein
MCSRENTATSPHLLAAPREETVSQRIRVTTRPDLFERRKQEHLRAGYRIEDEHPIPINGMCSFVAVRIVSEDEAGG